VGWPGTPVETGPLRDPHAVAEQGHFLRFDRHHEFQQKPFGIRRIRSLFLGLGFFPFDPCGAVLADRNVGNNKNIDLQP